MVQENVRPSRSVRVCFMGRMVRPFRDIDLAREGFGEPGVLILLLDNNDGRVGVRVKLKMALRSFEYVKERKRERQFMVSVRKVHSFCIRVLFVFFAKGV
jgi:hypothetical protein